MSKTKKVIISLCISLIILLVIVFIINSGSNNNFSKIPVFKEDILKGSLISKNQISFIDVKKDTIDSFVLKNIASVEEIKDIKLARNVNKGEIVYKGLFSEDENETSDFVYVSVPLTKDNITTCKNLKFGDKIDIFCTAKLKDIVNIIENKPKVYSNKTSDGLITCKVLENVEIAYVLDSTGDKEINTLPSNLVVRLSKEDAMTLINIKNIGDIDIALK